MSVAAAILVSTAVGVVLAGFGGLGFYLRRIEVKLDELADRLTAHELSCAERWARRDAAEAGPEPG